MTPTQNVLSRVTETRAVIDAAGRRLLVRRATVIDTLRLLKAAGPLLAENQPWLGMAIMAMCVLSIDDLPIPAPQTEAQIESVFERLGDDGLAAVAGAFAADGENGHQVDGASLGN
jgi:hypothetical protein